MGSTILITGGAGYIGSVTVERLLEAGRRVVVLDDLSKGHRSAVHPDAVFQEGDIGDVDLVGRLIEEHGVGSVVHFAAMSLVGESMTRPAQYYDNNVVKGSRLLETMLEHDVRKIVFSSSAGVYGEPEAVPIPEDAPTEPVNVYGDTKRAFERVLEWRSEHSGLGYISLRYFNAAGASTDRGEDHDPETHLIPLALQAVAGRRPGLTVFGNDYDTPDGTCVRDYIDIRDLSDAHIAALDALDKGRKGVYNLGNGEGYSVLEVIETVESVAGEKVPWSYGARREGDPARLVASASLAREELEWRPSHPELADMVGAAWDWMKRFPEGYRD